MIPKSWYEHPIFRAFMRGVRVGAVLMISAILAALAKEPSLLLIAPFLAAIDKYIRDHPPSE